MSFFRTTEKLHHVTSLPPGTDRSIAISVLHDHVSMMHFGPHLHELEPLPTDPERPDAKAYKVTDIMDMLPKGIWSSNVVSTYYYTDTVDGVDMVIKSPLDVLMETHWTVQEQDGGLVLDEDVTIHCSRFLIGTVRGQCDGNYTTIHSKLAERVKELQAEGKGASEARLVHTQGLNSATPQ